jgi:hypothetical protein
VDVFIPKYKNIKALYLYFYLQILIMQAKTYFTILNKSSQEVFNKSMEKCNFIGELHSYSASLQDWATIIPFFTERRILNHAVEQMEISCLSMLTGIYRQSFASLRLSLELIFGAVYFSAHKLELIEWQNGAKDLNWHVI